MFQTPYEVDFSNRNPHPKTDPMFSNRWSPRSFKKTEISQEVRESIFDAARWAPSAFNAQPWKIFASSGDQDFDKFLDILVEMNQSWAKNASIIGFLLYENNFSHNGNPNKWAPFDLGFVWASLTFQANKFGLYTHGMAGFVEDKVYEVFDVDREKYTAIAAFAIGEVDSPDKLDEKFAEKEIPSSRKNLDEIYFPGGSSLK